MFRIRFSMRALLIFTTLAGVLIYLFALPTLNATNYVSMLERGDFAEAAKLYTGGSRFPVPDADVDPESVRIEAQVERFTFRGLIGGRRAINLSFTYDISGAELTYLATSVSTRKGIQILSVEPQ